MIFLAIVLHLLFFVLLDGAKSRGGPRSRKGSTPNKEYYDQYDIDYGTDDNARLAGSLRGFIETGKLSSLNEKDEFLKWINKYMESGPEPLDARTKPFYVSYVNQTITLVFFKKKFNG